MPVSSSSDSPVIPKQPPKKRRPKIRRWIVLVTLIAIPVWLNGPGLRWLAPVIGGHFIEKAGYQASFRIEGSLTGGLAIHDLDLKGPSVLTSLRASRISIDYTPSDLMRATVSRIGVDSLHAEVDLNAPSVANADSPTDASGPFDIQKLMVTLRDIRTRVLPVEIDLRGLSVEVNRGETPFIALGSTALRHQPGNPELHLDLGALTDSNGKAWPARKALITWKAESITLDRLDALPGVGIRDLLVRLPVSGEPSASTELHLDDAVLMIEAGEGFRSATLDLRQGRVDAPAIAKRLGIDIPASGEVSSLSLNVENILPDPLAADAEIRLLLESVRWRDWTVPELSLDLDLAGSAATLAASGRVLDSGVSINADVSLGQGCARFDPTAVAGRFNVADVTSLLAALAPRVPAIDPLNRVPASMLDGGFSVALDHYKPSSTEFSVLLKPHDPKLASSVSIKGRMPDDATVEASLDLDGARLRAVYQIKSRSYAGEASFDNFRTSRIDPWLLAFKAGTGGAAVLTGNWKGSGEIGGLRHTGQLALAGLDVNRKDVPPASAAAEISYDWPSGFSLDNLKLTSAEQTVTTHARLAGGFLTLSDLQWADHGNLLATGSAKLPVPSDFSKWREMLASDTRPVSLDIESKVISLALLRNWLPAAAKLDPKSTGLLKVKVSGTFPEPEIDLLTELKYLRSPGQPKAPPADLTVSASGRDGLLKVDAQAITPDYPPAVLKASMPFRPVEWANHPDLVKSEKLTARLDLPKLDVSRFGSLVAAAEKISGSVTGNVEVAGELAKPVIKGRLDLTNGALILKDSKVSPITNADATVEFALDRITLAKCRATMSAGTIDAGGSLRIENGKPGPLDFRIRASQLPILRDDSIILRANADLRLAGTYEKASLTGTAGVVNSLFFRDIELLPIGSPFTGPSAAALPRIDAARVNPGSAIPEPFRNWTLDVRMRTENPFLVRGNLAKGQADADIRVRGTLGTPAPDGVANIRNLQAALPFSTLKISSGTLRFTPASGFDPVLEIRGTAEPRPYRVNVFAYGSLSKPQLLLTSSPPLPEAEIMTLLATGTTTSGLENTQAASSRAMQLVIEEFRRGRFAGSKYLRPVLGLLDRVDFSLAEADPYSSESFSTATINLTDRWYVSAGMGAEGDTRLMGIWRISFR